MKFLVFNIVVLLSLGYLITGQKNQSVGNWLDALPEKILNSYETKDLTNFLPEKQVELAQTPAKNVSEVESLVSKNVEDKVLILASSFANAFFALFNILLFLFINLLMFKYILIFPSTNIKISSMFHKIKTCFC